MKVVKRAINGISINGTEYLLDDTGGVMLFDDETTAINFLVAHGVDEDEIEDYHIINKDF